MSKGLPSGAIKILVPPGQWPCPQIIDCNEKCLTEKPSSLFCSTISDEKKWLISLTIIVTIIKLIFCITDNLRISLSVCPLAGKFADV